MTALVNRGKSLAPASLRASVKPLVHAFGHATAAVRRPPQFLLLGTKRGGTTSLWNALIRHPNVLPIFPAVQTLKSAHYYCENHRRGMGWYRGYFASDVTRFRVSHRTGAPTSTGECCPYYMYDPRTPALVARDMPDIKLVMVLRDPVERAYSHYRERVSNGLEPLDFASALAAEDDRVAGELDRMNADPFYYSRPHDYYTYRDHGVYLPQIKRWQELFPPEQVFITASEYFYERPQQTYDQIIDFLGLPQHTVQGMVRYNYEPAAGMDQASRARLTDFFREHNAALFEHLGTTYPWAS